MLKRLTIHGFKSIERQSIEPGSLNVLIGANGSGKSNLLAALSFFRASALGDRDTMVKRAGGADRVLFHGKKNTKACFFACEADGFNYEQTLIPIAGDRLEVAKEGLTILGSEVEWADGGANLVNLEDQLRNEERRYLQDAVSRGEMSEDEAGEALDAYPSPKQQIEGWRVYHLHDTSANAAVKSNCNVDDNRYLREDSANLAAYLYWLK